MIPMYPIFYLLKGDYRMWGYRFLSLSLERSQLGVVSRE